jgi:RNA polymerase sigma factor (TIGR02999 family)
LYTELRALAEALLSREAPGHTLQATALVNEAYLRLVGPTPVTVAGKRHFFALAAGVIRHILVDHARTRSRLKRGGGGARVTLSEIDHPALPDAPELLALDDALERLAKLSPRTARTVELKFFAGLTVEEIAQVLGVSERTVNSEWATARAWLAREMSGADRPDGASS